MIIPGNLWINKHVTLMIIWTIEKVKIDVGCLYTGKMHWCTCIYALAWINIRKCVYENMNCVLVYVHLVDLACTSAKVKLTLRCLNRVEYWCRVGWTDLNNLGKVYDSKLYICRTTSAMDHLAGCSWKVKVKVSCLYAWKVHGGADWLVWISENVYVSMHCSRTSASSDHMASNVLTWT